MNDNALIETFRKNAEQVQTQVQTIGSYQEAVEYAIHLALDRKVTCLAGVGLDAHLNQLLDAQCEKYRIERALSPFRDRSDSLHITLTAADWGIADTGSLVIHSESEDLRIATMLAETHIAILASNRIISGGDDLEQLLNPILKGDRASYTAVITGPSRTADIERILAIGVHGPQELHILIRGGTPDE